MQVDQLPASLPVASASAAVAMVAYGRRWLGKIAPQAAVLAILAALTANTAAKIAIAFAAGPRRYSTGVAAGLLLLVPPPGPAGSSLFCGGTRIGDYVRGDREVIVLRDVEY